MRSLCRLVLASAMWTEGSACHALSMGWLLPCGGKGQLIMRSGWVVFCVVGRVSLSCSQVGLSSVLWKGSAYHAPRLGWLLPRDGKGQL